MLIASSLNSLNMPVSLRGILGNLIYTLCTGNQYSINHLNLILLFSSQVRNALLCFIFINSYVSSHLERWSRNKELVELNYAYKNGTFSVCTTQWQMYFFRLTNKTAFLSQSLVHPTATVYMLSRVYV